METVEEQKVNHEIRQIREKLSLTADGRGLTQMKTRERDFFTGANGED
jgi:hypothetical protein